MKYPKRSQYKYAKSPYRIRNWPEYEAGLRRRGEALVHGSGFRCIMVVKPRSGVGTDEVSETQPVQVRKIPIPDP